MAQDIQSLGVCHMEDQRVILGTALGGKDLADCLRVQSVGTQSVYSFRRNGHKTAIFDDVCRSAGCLGVLRR